jgi:hypothetical protein
MAPYQESAQLYNGKATMLDYDLYRREGKFVKVTASQSIHGDGQHYQGNLELQRQWSEALIRIRQDRKNLDDYRDLANRGPCLNFKPQTSSAEPYVFPRSSSQECTSNLRTTGLCYDVFTEECSFQNGENSILIDCESGKDQTSTTGLRNIVVKATICDFSNSKKYALYIEYNGTILTTPVALNYKGPTENPGVINVKPIASPYNETAEFTARIAVKHPTSSPNVSREAYLNLVLREYSTDINMPNSTALARANAFKDLRLTL